MVIKKTENVIYSVKTAYRDVRLYTELPESRFSACFPGILCTGETISRYGYKTHLYGGSQSLYHAQKMQSDLRTDLFADI